MNIKILGSGCPSCNKLEENTKQALKELNKTATLEKVTDYKQIVAYGVMRTPTLVVNGKVVLSGRVPSVDEIKELF